MMFFAYFSVSKKRNIKRSRNGTKSTGEVIFSTNVIQETWSVRQKRSRRARGRGRAYPPRHALHPCGPLVAPPTYFFILYISTYPKHPGAPRKPNSTATTFCTREIPSRGLFRSSAGGGIDHRGPLHKLHGPSDDV